jgi:predicted DNA-binding protein (UPF0251 family)
MDESPQEISAEVNELWEVITGRLTDDEAEAITLVFREGMTYREAADKSGRQQKSEICRNVQAALDRLRGNETVAKYLRLIVAKTGQPEPGTPAHRISEGAIQFGYSIRNSNNAKAEELVDAAAHSLDELDYLGDKVLELRRSAHDRKDAILAEACDYLELLVPALKRTSRQLSDALIELDELEAEDEEDEDEDSFDEDEEDWEVEDHIDGITYCHACHGTVRVDLDDEDTDDED